MMAITSTTQALELLDNYREESSYREAAIHYLTDHSSPAVIVRLVQALQDDDVGVRWVAAMALAQLGEAALPEILKALTDPVRVGDPRLREGIYHILHNNQRAIPVPITDLLAVLKGPVAGIASLVEADRVIREYEKYRAVEEQAAIGPQVTGINANE